MKLDKWLKKNKKVLKHFAEQELSVTEQTLHNWLNGLEPSKRNRLKIQDVTNGQVSMKDWF